MSKIDSQKLFFKISTVAILFPCLMLLSKGTSFFTAKTQEPQQESRLPEILIEPQPDTPLVISPLRVYSPKPQVCEILYNLTNISKKPIRAYTIRQEMFVGEQEQKGATWVDLELTNKTLPPNQPIHGAYAFEIPSKQTLSDITLAVDFVEITDGTTWGADLIKSAERITATRSGARETVQRLLKIFNERGASAVMNALDSGVLDFSPPAGHAADWNSAFDDGKKLTKARLKRAMEKGGLNQVERALLENLFNYGNRYRYRAPVQFNDRRILRGRWAWDVFLVGLAQ